MRRRIQFTIGVATAMALLGVPRPAAAQGDGGVLTITLAGPSNTVAPVMVSEGATRRTVAQAGAGAPLRLAMDAINIGKGKRVGVQVTGDAVLLVPDGTIDAGCAEATRREDECRRIAAVTWGESATIGLGWKDGLLAQSGTSFHRFRIGADYSLSTFTRLDAVACSDAIAGLTSCDNDNAGRGVGVYLEYGITPWLGIGARGSTSGYQVMQQFGDRGVDHDVSLTMLDIYGRLQPPGDGPIIPWAMLGGSWFDNADEIDGEEMRSESGLRLVLGGGLDWRFRDRFSVRGGVGYGSGGSTDADSHWRSTFGAHFHF